MMTSMGLRITDIELFDFRNHERLFLHGLGELTILTGRNGVGKTNVLEAVQLVTSTSSFRHARIAQLVREGADSARVWMQVSDGNRLVSTELVLEDGKKRYLVNNKPKGALDVRGTLPAVVFTPDDLQLAKKSSSVKRDAIDELGGQLTKNYRVIAGDYDKALRYKNRLLKDEAPDELVSAINETLVMCGSQLFCYRVALFGRMLPLLQALYSRISNKGAGEERFSASYVPSWDRLLTEDGLTLAGEGLVAASPLNMRDNGAPDREQAREYLLETIERVADEERRRHRSLVGPHNDLLTFSLSGRDASAFASQGQQRSIVLAWKLAEVEVIRQTLGENPVLLLDDVLSELDESRRNALVDFAGEGIQTFITATDLSGFSKALLGRARVVDLG